MKRIISVSGRFTGKKVRKLCEHRIKSFEVISGGLKHLQDLQGRPYLIVANHLNPREKLAEKFNITPDAFIFSNLVGRFNEQRLAIIQRSDDGYWFESSFGQYVQREIFWPFAKGFVDGAENIPIKKNPGSFNRDFLTGALKARDDKRPMLIFPEGCWYPDYDASDPNRIIQPGAARIAKSLKLPILPAYIRGAHSWIKQEERVVAFFGPSFLPKDMDVEAIRLAIREKIAESQYQANLFCQ